MLFKEVIAVYWKNYIKRQKHILWVKGEFCNFTLGNKYSYHWALTVKFLSELNFYLIRLCGKTESLTHFNNCTFWNGSSKLT